MIEIINITIAPRENTIPGNQSSSIDTSGISNLSSSMVLLITETGEGNMWSRKQKLVSSPSPYGQLNYSTNYYR